MPRAGSFARAIAAALLIASSPAALYAQESGDKPATEGDRPAPGRVGSEENPLVMVPGKTTVADLVDMGLREITAKEYNEANGSSVGPEYSYISFNDFLVVAKNGVTTAFYFQTAKRGAVPPEWMIGVPIDPKASYRGLISFLSDEGFTIREVSSPAATFPDGTNGREARSAASFIVRGSVNSDIAFVFNFDTRGFWTADEPGTLDRITAYPAATMNKYSVKITKPEPLSPGNERQQALDLGVVLSAQNKESYDGILPRRKDDTYDSVDGWKGIISNSWGINGREDYFRVFDDMVAEGHAKSYTDAMALLDENPGVPILRLAIANGLDAYHCDRLFFVAQTREWLGARSLKAWDLGRMVNVTRWAYAAGFIDEDEAWERILPVAKTLRELYRSREDFIASYIGGRGFFGAGDPATYMESAYAAYVGESGKLDSRQNLPWYLPGEEPDETKTDGETADRDAKIGDILYTVTDEQTSARIVYKRLGGSIDGMNAALKAGDGTAAINATADAITVLKGNRIGEYYPDLYYRLRFIRGYVFAVTGNYSLALDELHEFDDRFPGDKDAQALIAKCENGIQGKASE